MSSKIPINEACNNYYFITEFIFFSSASKDLVFGLLTEGTWMSIEYVFLCSAKVLET